ncbi:MAG: hypothetical protein KAY65_12320 [Planctomycetes bacterium]|nr:hypothetical protein [Planctomycetota bacterium]
MSVKLRIAAAAGVGVVLIGILAWPLAEPSEPFGPVRPGNLALGGTAVLAVLAFLSGLIGYFVSWPHGREIGILAVPSGLTIWAIRSGNIASLMQLEPALEQRRALLAALRWEPLFWLAIVGIGFAGVLCGRRIRCGPGAAGAENKPKSKSNIYLNAAIALVASVLIAQVCLGRLAQDIQFSDNRLGSVTGQPAMGQIVFGVLVAFGLAAFVVKSFLNAGYLWPIIASALVTAFSIMSYVKQDALKRLVQYWPAVFFSNPIISISPLEMVALGTLGSIAGYWMGIRYDFWRKHEI